MVASRTAEGIAHSGLRRDRSFGHLVTVENAIAKRCCKADRVARRAKPRALPEEQS